MNFGMAKDGKKSRKIDYKPSPGPRQFARVLTTAETLIAVERKRENFPLWDIAREIGCAVDVVEDCLARFDREALLRSTIKVAIEKENMLAELKHAKMKVWKVIRRFEDEDFVSISTEKGFTANGPVDKETVTREKKVAPASYYDTLSKINKQIAELLGLDDIKEAGGQMFAILKMPSNGRDKSPDNGEDRE